MTGSPKGAIFCHARGLNFFNANFNVLFANRASDLNCLEYGYRVSKDHVAELAKVIAYVHEKFGKLENPCVGGVSQK